MLRVFVRASTAPSCRAIHFKSNRLMKKTISPYDYKDMKESTDWLEQDKKHAVEDHWARQREMEIMQKALRLMQQKKATTMQQAMDRAHSHETKHYFVQFPGKSRKTAVDADSFGEFQSKVGHELGRDEFELHMNLTIDGESHAVDFNEAAFDKYDGKVVFVE
eukprot:NODE_2008_length_673_cov_77.426740_g1958_i0.p1 GENE.NODE_2008_length_673_cov_77.426740_g1958_i0~~NODE_2008_length_673_cov_77.426740_g1958_i0.p1  ORF type:complete len:163 (-),score=36.95 NODE_2008_length_673_cov_77.426740_g1958_i0:114-602(-)